MEWTAAANATEGGDADMAENVFARVEKKFLISEQQERDITCRLESRGFSFVDFGNSLVQSIYFDTPDDLLIRRSLERPNYKEKIRLRAYGIADRNSTVFMEIKKKYQKTVFKRRTALPLSEALEAVRKGQLPASCGQIGEELTWCFQRYRLMPKMAILYNRQAFVQPGTDTLRVTFDRSIRFRREPLDVTFPAFGTMLLPDDRVLMEVKIPGTYPLWLIRMIEETGAQGTHLSKYGLAYQKTMVDDRKDEKKHA